MSGLARIYLNRTTRPKPRVVAPELVFVWSAPQTLRHYSLTRWQVDDLPHKIGNLLLLGRGGGFHFAFGFSFGLHF